MAVENRGIDTDYFDFLCKRWQAPVHRSLDFSLEYLGQGIAGVKTTAGHEYSTIRGRLHGGILATLADTAMGWAVISLGYICMTVDMYTNYFAQVFEDDDIIAEAKVLNMGNRTAVAEVSIFNAKGEIVAASRGTFSVKPLIRKEFETDV